MNWIMSMARKPVPGAPSYAVPVHPSAARAAFLTSDLATLFRVLRGWQTHLTPEGEYVTAFAVPADITPSGQIAPTWDADDERMIRLDYQPSGFITLRTHQPARQVRPALPAPPVRPALTTRPHRHPLPAGEDNPVYPAGDYHITATCITRTGLAVMRGPLTCTAPATYSDLAMTLYSAALRANELGMAEITDVTEIRIVHRETTEPGGSSA